jgi:hypothetical protein
MPEPVVELAKSDRSKCCISGALIEKHAWRIRFNVVPGLMIAGRFVRDATKFAAADAFLTSLKLRKREGKSQTRICTIGEDYIKVGELYVAFSNGYSEQAILFSRAVPFLKKITGICGLTFDGKKLIEQSALSKKDQRKAINEHFDKQVPEKDFDFRRDRQPAKCLKKRPASSKCRATVRQKPMAVKQRILKAKRGKSTIPLTEKPTEAGLEQLVDEFSNKWHDKVMEWGRLNRMNSVELRPDADVQKDVFQGCLSALARGLQKRMKR